MTIEIGHSTKTIQQYKYVTNAGVETIEIGQLRQLR